jgi:hypothetical protein
MTQPTNTDNNRNDTYYPYLSRDDKIDAYKKAIIQSLDLSVHPEHLKRVRVKLDQLEKFWKAEWSKK